MKTFCAFLILCSVVFVSCSKDEILPNTISSKQVPDSTGDFWKYSIHSANGEQQGFLEVRIIKRSILPDGRPVTTWIYSYPQFTDTVYKVLADTSLEEYAIFPGITSYDFPIMRYVFPLETGNKWAISPSLYTDSVEVASEVTIQTPAGPFGHTFQLNMIGTRHIGNYWNNSQYWVTPYIGITRMVYIVYNLGSDIHNGTYDLVEYRLH